MFAVTGLSLLKSTNLHKNYICCIKNYIKKTYTSLLKNQRFVLSSVPFNVTEMV